MAPIRDTTRDDVLRALAAAEDGWSMRVFRDNTPVALVASEGGAWFIAALALDRRAVKAAEAAAAARGEGFRPEHMWACYAPGRRIIAARSRTALGAAIRLMPWPPRAGPLNLPARCMALLHS